MKRTVIFATILMLTFPAFGFSPDVYVDIPAGIQTPQNLADWMLNEFKYREEYPVDKWQSPKETIEAKEGDCEDFAILSSVVLNRLNIANDIIVLKFKNLETGHVICAWKDEEGFFNFISNRKLLRTGKTTIEDAVSKYYPEWETLIYTNQKKHYLSAVRR